jgi:PadR family transcriptional regulator AphA
MGWIIGIVSAITVSISPRPELSPLSLKHALLVLLDASPASGYDLRKRFGEHMGYFWSASHQQIYQQLKKLNEAGEISCELIPQPGKPDKKIYTLTGEGRSALQSWLEEPAKSVAVNDALLVKLYAGHLADPGDLQREMSRHREKNERKLQVFLGLEAEYQATSKGAQAKLQMPYLTLRRGILEVKAWLQWCTEVEQTLADLVQR